MFKPMLAMMTMAFCMAVAGCGGSKTIVKNQDSCGKQLTDLQNAYNRGAMSESEYERARDKTVERCNHGHD